MLSLPIRSAYRSIRITSTTKKRPEARITESDHSILRQLELRMSDKAWDALQVGNWQYFQHSHESNGFSRQQRNAAISVARRNRKLITRRKVSEHRDPIQIALKRAIQYGQIRTVKLLLKLSAYTPSWLHKSMVDKARLLRDERRENPFLNPHSSVRRSKPQKNDILQQAFQSWKSPQELQETIHQYGIKNYFKGERVWRQRDEFLADAIIVHTESFPQISEMLTSAYLQSSPPSPKEAFSILKHILHESALRMETCEESGLFDRSAMDSMDSIEYEGELLTQQKLAEAAKRVTEQLPITVLEPYAGNGLLDKLVPSMLQAKIPFPRVPYEEIPFLASLQKSINERVRGPRPRL